MKIIIVEAEDSFCERQALFGDYLKDSYDMNSTVLGDKRLLLYDNEKVLTLRIREFNC